MNDDEYPFWQEYMDKVTLFDSISPGRGSVKSELWRKIREAIPFHFTPTAELRDGVESTIKGQYDES